MQGVFVFFKVSQRPHALKADSTLATWIFCFMLRVTFSSWCGNQHERYSHFYLGGYFDTLEPKLKASEVGRGECNDFGACQCEPGGSVGRTGWTVYFVRRPF